MEMAGTKVVSLVIVSTGCNDFSLQYDLKQDLCKFMADEPTMSLMPLIEVVDT